MPTTNHLNQADRDFTMAHALMENETLKRSEQFALATLDALEANLCVLNEAGRILAVNKSWRAFARANGLGGPAASVGANYLSVCDAVAGADREDAAAFAAGIRAVLRGESETFSREYACHSSQERRWFLGRVTRFSEGGRVRLVVSHSNITARRLAEEALQASEQKLRRLGDNLPAGLVYEMEVGPEGHRRFTYVSAGVERIHGIPAERVLQDASALYRQIVEEDRAMLAAKEVQCHRDQVPLSHEARIRRPDGEVRWVYLHSAPTRLPGGTIRWDGLELDITERKHLEERLRQSQKLESIGLLAGGLAHEFNNILAAMMMNLSLFSLSNPNLENSGQLREMEEHCTRAADLIKQLLAFSRQSVMERRPLDLAALVTAHCRMIKPLIGEHIAVELSLADDLPRVQADRTLTEQVLMNLCLNARDAMKGGGRLHISLSQVEVGAEAARAHEHVRPGGFVCLSVADTGCGMDDRTTKRLFEPFFTTKEVGQGTGLGLATVRGIVQQHQGWIEVDSHVGQGSTFRVYLPAAIPPPAAYPAPLDERH